jgi:AcrR family transcriptional regulator
VSETINDKLINRPALDMDKIINDKVHAKRVRKRNCLPIKNDDSLSNLSYLDSNHSCQSLSSHKRKTKKALETQKRILEAALDLFRTKGFEATSMRDIAEKATVAVGASYYYYSTKEELVLSYYELECTKELEFAQKLATETYCLKTRLKLFLHNKLERITPDRGFITILVKSFIDPKEMLVDYKALFQSIKGKETAAYSFLVEGSGLRVSEVVYSHLPKLLWLLSVMILVYWLHDQSKEQTSTRELIDRLVYMITDFFNNTAYMASDTSLKMLGETLTLLTGFHRNFVNEYSLDGIIERKYSI